MTRQTPSEFLIINVKLHQIYPVFKIIHKTIDVLVPFSPLNLLKFKSGVLKPF